MITVNEARLTTQKAIETQLTEAMKHVHEFLDYNCDKAIAVAAKKGLTSCTVEIPPKLETNRHLIASLLEDGGYKANVRWSSDNTSILLIIWG